MRKVVVFLILGLLYAYTAISLGRVGSISFDSVQYFSYGKNLLLSGVYGEFPGVPDMNREPGYGFFLASIFASLRGAGLLSSHEAASELSSIFWVKFIQAFFLYVSAWLCAFHAGLPKRISWPLFLIAILSPSTMGASREIYSEALSIPLSFLLLFFLSRAIQGGGTKAYFGLGLCQALVVLTKSYLYPVSLLALAATPLFYFRPIWRRGLQIAIPLALGGLLAQKAWDIRNQRMLGESGHQARKSIALAGKIARINRVNWAEDWKIALAGSLGTNFCDKLYGGELCSRFDYRGCDEIGLQTLAEYRSRFGSGFEADRHIQKDMIQLFFHRPLTQLLGNGLELLRMFFFEAVLDSTTFPKPMQGFLRAWHILGSGLFWIFILASWTQFWLQKDSSGAERSIFLLCAGFIAYHAATMSQITNVVRYVFPILPFLYYFVADGISTALERISAWRAKRKNRILAT